MFKRHNLKYPEPYHRSMKKTNAAEDMNNDWDIDNIDDCLVNFGISDDDLDILLNEVTNGHNPSSAAKKAIEGVDQKGLANLLTRIFTIAMKNGAGPESLIPAAFVLISEILDISALAHNSQPGENPILSSCLKNLEKASMSGDDWEKLPDILADSYVRWDLTRCVGEILVKWLAGQSVEELEHEKVVIGRGVKSCQVLLGKIGVRICSDLPGRFVQLQQMAKRLLLGEECRNREELLEIVIMLAAVNEREAIGHEEEGKVDDNREQIDLRINCEDEDDGYEELISFAELGKLKQKLEEKKPSKKMKLISPSQFEYVDYEDKIDDVNNNDSTEIFGIDVDSCPIDIDGSKCKIKDEEGEKLPQHDALFSSEIEVEMTKISLLDICDANDKHQKQSLKLTPSNNSKNANDSPTIEAKYDSKGQKLLGYLESLDNPQDPKSSVYPVTAGCYVGRLPSCQVTIDGPKVSRLHATIFKTVDGIFLQTLSKTNGCCVNNNIIRTDNFIRIVNGDKVVIGGIPFVWIENGGRDENAINKVKKEGEELEIEMVEKDLDGKGIKREGVSTNKKNKSKLNVAAVLEASLKKMEKSVTSGQVFTDSGIISDVPMKVPDLSVPPPSANFQMMENKNQDANDAGGDNIIQSLLSESPTRNDSKHSLPNLSVPPPNVEILAVDKGQDEPLKVPSRSESRSSNGKPFVFGLFQSKKIRPSNFPNFAIPPPNIDIPTQKKEENKRKYGSPKVQHSVKTPETQHNSGIQFHTQMLKKKNLKSKRPQSSSRSALGGEKPISPSPRKQSSSEMVASSVSTTGQWEENTGHDERDFIKMPKKIQEIDDVVIESERFITDY